MKQGRQEKAVTSEELAAPAVGYIMRQVERDRYQHFAAGARQALARVGLSIDSGTLGALYATWQHEQENRGKEAHAPAND